MKKIVLLMLLAASVPCGLMVMTALKLEQVKAKLESVERKHRELLQRQSICINGDRQ